MERGEIGDREVLLLGPVAVHADGQVVPMVGTRAKALLALLALASPQPVSDDRLIEAVWAGSPPSKPANALQAKVSALRRLLGPATVVRRGDGYALDDAGWSVDAHRLEALVEDGQAAAADGHHDRTAAAFRAAVDLLRGPPLEDLVDLPFARDDAPRLEQLALAAHEGSVEADLASGRHVEVLPRLLELVREHPYREHLHALLMVALYRSGRQEEALRAYQDVRTLLADELGLEPGPELRDLERAVLSQDSALAAPVPLASVRPPQPVPTPRTSFVGRVEELQALRRAVAEHRLVTVVGPAGVGKTRLVLAAARDLPVDGEQWFVELAPVRTATAVIDAVAEAVGAHDLSPVQPGVAPRPALDRVADRLGRRNVLLVVDNAEHLLAEVAAVVGRLLDLVPELRILVTSREPLGLDGEQQLLLGPLSDDESVALFTARADAVRPGVPPRTTDRAALLDLCRRLDGLPLAIELAAARSKSLPIAELTARLTDRFAVLVPVGPEDDRRHGLRAAIAGSYDLLSTDERRAFCRLAVFSGGASTDAAFALCGPDALDLVARLVDKSMLVADLTGTEGRFGMLESLRAFGRERLEADGDLAPATAARLDHLVAFAEAVAVGIRGPEQLTWLARLDHEHENLMDALDEAVGEHPDAVLRIVGALALPWWLRGRGPEGWRWVRAAVDLGPGEDEGQRARVLTWFGLLVDFGGGVEHPGGFERLLDEAEGLQREAVAVLGTRPEHGEDLPYAQLQLALTLRRQALVGRAIDHGELGGLLDGSMAGFEHLGDDFGFGLVATLVAVGHLAEGDADQTAVAAARALESALRCGDRYVQGRVAWLEGLLAGAAGRPDEAYGHVERALRLLDELGMGREVTVRAGLLAELAERRGRPELAAQWQRFVDARTRGLDRHDVLLLASARNVEGLQARARGDLDGARSAHLRALEQYGPTGVDARIAFTESCLGFLAAAMGDVEDEVTHHRAALTAAARSDDRRALALALEGVASCRGEGDAGEAVTLLGAADALWTADGPPADVTHRDDVSALGERLREHLGDEAFAVAFSRGRDLSLSGAVALATTG